MTGGGVIKSSTRPGGGRVDGNSARARYSQEGLERKAHELRMKTVKSIVDTTRPLKMPSTSLWQNGKRRGLRRDYIDNIKPKNSLLAQRVIAIMAGDPSAMSEYAQERLMSPALVKMETLGERRRRVMQRQINQENQVISRRLIRATSLYCQNKLRPYQPPDGLFNLARGGITLTKKAAEIPDKPEVDFIFSTSPATKAIGSPRRPEASEPPQDRATTYHRRFQWMADAAAKVVSNVSQAVGMTSYDQDLEEAAGHRSFPPAAAAIRPRPAAAPATKPRHGNLVVKKALRIDERYLLATVLKDKANVCHILSVTDLRARSVVTVKIPDNELYRLAYNHIRDPSFQYGDNDGDDPVDSPSFWVPLFKSLFWVDGGELDSDKMVMNLPGSQGSEDGSRLGLESLAVFINDKGCVLVAYLIQMVLIFTPNGGTRRRHASQEIQSVHISFRAIKGDESNDEGDVASQFGDTTVDCTNDSIKSFSEYVEVDYQPQQGRPFWERLLNRLIAELYLYDRGDGLRVCAGPIYYFTLEDNPTYLQSGPSTASSPLKLDNHNR